MKDSATQSVRKRRWRGLSPSSADDDFRAGRQRQGSMRSSHRHDRDRGRFGFTLLETMLALGISALLLAGIYAAIDQSWRTAASGREEMERAQLARALIHRLEQDLRAITYVPPPPVDETESTTSSSSSNSEESTTTEETEDTTPNSKSIGIRGTNIRMDMSIARARRDLLPGMGTALNGVNSTTPAAAAVSPLRTSDLRFVSYSFLPSGVSASSGLVRFEGDRMAAEVQEEKGANPTNVSTPQVLAPEVATFELRYFDGRIWYATWDSDTMGRIPRAVEIKFSFHPPKRKPPLLNAAVSRSMDSFRSVILIPVSDPFPKEFIQ